MKIKVYLAVRTTEVQAEAIYEGDTITVLPGGTISDDFADYIRGGRSAKTYRENPEYVDGNRKILKGCTFTSPSTAAQFVTGRSKNGYKAWKVDKKTNLGTYLKENGLR